MKAEEGVIGVSVPSWMSSLNRWLICEELTRQCSIEKSEQEIDKWYYMLSQAEQKPCLKSRQRVGKQVCSPTHLKDSQDEGERTLVSDLRWSLPLTLKCSCTIDTGF